MTNYTPQAGDWYQDAKINQVNKSAVAIAKGDVIGLVVATDDFTTAATGASTRRFAVAVEAAAASDTKVRAATGGMVNVTADGAIGAGNKVKVSAATAGQVIEAVEGSDAYNTIVGTYIGKPGSGNERDGVTTAAAADNDIIVIDLGNSV